MTTAVSTSTFVLNMSVVAALKHLASFGSATLLVVALTASAHSCLLVPNSELAGQLENSGFPLALLSRAHIAAFEQYGNFLQCDWGFGPYEDWSLSASRRLDDVYWETVVFSAFGFPSHAAAVAGIADRVSQEAHAEDNPNTDIYYYIDPEGGAAFRVSRARHTLGEG